jgi:hypothetical protein
MTPVTMIHEGQAATTVRRPLRWPRAIATVLAWLIILGMIGGVCAPALKDIHTLGWHDWDQMEAHRYLVYKTIRFYHQFPFWNPYGCGGHTSWGGLESGTTIVSPWLLPYLFMSLAVALRIELVGMALISALGTWLLAGRFTRSAGVRAFVCAIFVVNGRWALQAATGHTWHLYYAWTPWVLYFFDVACAPPSDVPNHRARNVVLAGVCIALMVYGGAIYPLPETGLLLGVYACLLAFVTRRWTPVANLLGVALVGFGLAAPKLLPMLESLGKYPRLVFSSESIEIATFFTILTSHDQGIGSRPAEIHQWGWHEYGMFIGWAALVALICGALFSKGPRATALKWTAGLILLLGFGDFHEYSPWNQLHNFPIFRSQHVPTRWLYVAVLLFGLLAAMVAERLLHRAGRGRAVGELLALGFAAFVAYDVGRVAVVPMQSAFGMKLPDVHQEFASFHTEKNVPASLHYTAGDYAPPALPSEMANVGTIECITFPGLNVFARDGAGKAPGLGAKGNGDPAYKGEVFTLKQGKAEVEKWTPNAVTVRVSDAVPGDLVVLNQNYDPGWRVDGAPAINFQDTVAATIREPSQTVVFRYRPRLWWWSLLIFVATVAGIVAAFRLRRRWMMVARPIPEAPRPFAQSPPAAFTQSPP